MISKSLLLLAFAALAHSQTVRYSFHSCLYCSDGPRNLYGWRKLNRNVRAFRQLWCASTWTGQSLDLPICTTMTAYPEMSKQCLQSEVNGSRQLMYTIDKDDTDFCLVCDRSLDLCENSCADVTSNRCTNARSIGVRVEIHTSTASVHVLCSAMCAVGGDSLERRLHGCWGDARLSRADQCLPGQNLRGILSRCDRL